MTQVLGLLSLLLLVLCNLSLIVHGSKFPTKDSYLGGRERGGGKEASGEIAEKSLEDQPWEKRQSFNPWGGKRTENAPQELDSDKRAFSPWGGKRGFNPWGGKRAFSPWGGKRAFSPWGGKRSDDIVTEEDKRAFSPWGGKRAFSPWGGKRAFSPWGGKRSFSPWGGKLDIGMMTASDDNQLPHSIVKRSVDLNQVSPFQGYSKEDLYLAYALLDELKNLKEKYQQMHEDDEEKRSFNPWGGKRAFSPWGGKRAFNPWGGKRSFNPWGGKRAFSPWGGKRSPEEEMEYGYQGDEEPHFRFTRDTREEIGNMVYSSM